MLQHKFSFTRQIIIQIFAQTRQHKTKKLLRMTRQFLRVCCWNNFFDFFWRQNEKKNRQDGCTISATFLSCAQSAHASSQSPPPLQNSPKIFSQLITHTSMGKLLSQKFQANVLDALTMFKKCRKLNFPIANTSLTFVQALKRLSAPLLWFPHAYRNRIKGGGGGKFYARTKGTQIE